jgi:O-antigen/teichoic acid export membrane protein
VIGKLALRRLPSLWRDTGWMLLAQGGRLAAQAAYFVIVARSMGVHTFGQLVSIVALIAILTPFAALGAGNVLVMGVARDPTTFRTLFGNALVSVLVTSWLLIPLTLGIAAVWLHGLPLEAVLLLSIAEYVFGAATNVGAMAFQAFDRLDRTAALGVVGPGLRALAAVAFVTLPIGSGLVVWSVCYLVAAVAGTLIALGIVVRELGGPRMSLRLLRRHVRLGAYFAASACATTIYGDIDKTMLGRLASFEAAGIYAAADRVVGMAFTPVMALLTAAYARFFRAGSEGMRGTAAYAKRLLPVSLGYGILVGLFLLLAAPVVPLILGDSYQDSVEALRWLAVIPALSALYYLAADALTGADAQGIRTVFQVLAAILNVGLNLILIPAYSWRGAAWATIASVGFLAAGLWITTIVMARREERDGVIRKQHSFTLDLPEPTA